ncbi:acyltransferase [Bacteroides sp.]
MLKRIFESIYRRLVVYLGVNRYVNYLRRKGVIVGDNFCAFNLDTINIDLSRPTLITIGDNVSVNRNFTILTHDFVSGIFIRCYSNVLPSTGHVKIGNNVRTGQNVTILKGVTIGNNVFISANSLVTKDIPSNCIAGGSPCKIIMSLDSYYEKRKTACVNEAIEFMRSIQERFHRRPVLSDFREEYSLFVDGGNFDQYPELHGFIKKQLGEHFDTYIKTHKAMFSGFDEFLSAAGIQ